MVISGASVIKLLVFSVQFSARVGGTSPSLLVRRGDILVAFMKKVGRGGPPRRGYEGRDLSPRGPAGAGNKRSMQPSPGVANLVKDSAGKTSIIPRAIISSNSSQDHSHPPSRRCHHLRYKNSRRAALRLTETRWAAGDWLPRPGSHPTLRKKFTSMPPSCRHPSSPSSFRI